MTLGTYIPLQAQQLGDLRWQHRILLLMDPNGSPHCQQQLGAFKPHTAAMQERDLLLFVFDGKALLDQQGEKTPMGIREVPNPAFEGVVLIGKDGGVKLRKPFPVLPEEIFERIDAMPMRKAEIRDDR